MSRLRIGDVEITWLGHASVRIRTPKLVVYIDPYVLDKDPVPADIVLMTHDHFDHCVPENVEKIRKPGTVIITTKECARKTPGAMVISEGETVSVKGIKVTAVPAYNVDKSFHPRGFGVGYVVDIDGIRIYHAGDTDKIPEMEDLEGITVALLPIGGTYTMDEKDAAEAVSMIKPEIVVPIHYNYLEGLEKDPEVFKSLVRDAQVVILEPEGVT